VDETVHRLTLVVHDTGAGASPGALKWGRDHGVGLRNIERRLEHQYGAAASLSIVSTAGVGTRVEVRLPIVPAISDEEATAPVAV
jgi:sensor histidine kinase YesM